MRSLVLALASIAVMSCGAVDATPPSGQPTPSPPQIQNPSRFDVTLTERDHSATVRSGQSIELVLHAGAGMTPWQGVRSSDVQVLAPIPDTAATAVRGVTLAAFRAMRPGTSEITATAGASCSPGQACPMYAMLLKITITVTS